MARLTGFLAASFLFTILFVGIETVPSLDVDAWWGPGAKTTQSTEVTPFSIVWDDVLLTRLKKRLTNHRTWVPPLNGVGFTYGYSSNQMNSFLRYWANDYDFEERQNFFNQFPQYTTIIQGLKIHFIRVVPEVPEGVEIVPMVMMHGWPGSVREFYEAIPLITTYDPKRNFAVELVVPSLPGFGYSDPAARKDMGAAEIAVIIRNLMHRLNHTKFYIQGGDFGGITGSYISTLFPDEVLGYHTNFPYTLMKWKRLFEVFSKTTDILSIPQDVAISDATVIITERFGYFHEQATRPDSLGVSLTDSPAGLLAYVFEKIATGTNRTYLTLPDGGFSYKDYTNEQLLDNLMMYWAPGCMTSAMRIYAETANVRNLKLQLDLYPTNVPTWALQAPFETVNFTEDELKVKYPNLLKKSVVDKGGHFLALQYPAVFAKDVLDAVEAFRAWHTKNSS